MRPSASLCQTSRYRLLTLLLLVLLLGYIGTLTVNGSPITGKNFPHHKALKGGTPYKKDYYLESKCSDQFLQMKLGRKPLNARGAGRNKFSLLTFESVGPGQIRIKGNYSTKYICFSRKGRLILRRNPENVKCHWSEVPEADYIKLQSVANRAWFMGFNKAGRKMKGFRHATLQHNPKRRQCFFFTKWPKESHTPYSPFKSSDFKHIITTKPKWRHSRKLRKNRKRKNR